MPNDTRELVLSTKEHRWAVLAGISILVMAIVGGFAYGYAHANLHVPNDAMATASAVGNQPILLRLTILSWCVVAVLDLATTFAIYFTYRRPAPRLSLLVTSLRLVYTGILLLATAHLVPLSLDSELNGGVLAFESFDRTWSGGLVIFGIHLLALAQLVWIARFPWIPIAFLLALGGVGYIVLEGFELLGSESLAIPAIIQKALAIPMILGELLFAVLLIAARLPRLTGFKSFHGVYDKWRIGENDNFV